MTTPTATVLPIDFKLRPATSRVATVEAGAKPSPTYDADRWTPADPRWETAKAAPPRDAVRDLVRTDAYDGRPATMGPFGKQGAPYKKPSKGVTVRTEIGDGWRLEGSASPKHKGTLRVGVSRTF